MDCKEATDSYEAWLRKRTKIVEADLDYKHKEMAKDVFSFMRATYYRWAKIWPESCAPLSKAPAVLAVGDLHVENFGTWRDREGRLVWGINDFDEAFQLPYTNDLVRLAASAHLAIAQHDLAIKPSQASSAILKGYTKVMASGGVPFVLAEENEWLRTIVSSNPRKPVKFWKKLTDLSTVEVLPRKAQKTLVRALPDHDLPYRVVNRRSGLGSLGRQRFVALATWNGGLLAREVKARVPAASAWLGARKEHSDQYEQIIKHSIRAPDPFLVLRKAWVLRRLAPDASRIELAMLTEHHDEVKLLEFMGRETANIHLGSKHAIKEVKRDLAHRPRGWVHKAAKTMVEAITADWKSWCNSRTQ
jgi:Uncharacterized protein conserved in bacteria (DUF2252)